MILKENTLFKLPPLRGGSFGGLDRLYIPHSKLVLKEVTQRADTGDITLFCQADDGPERKQGSIKFEQESQDKKDILYKWLEGQVRNTIESIYSAEFSL